MSHFLPIPRRIALAGLLATTLSCLAAPVFAEPAQSSRLILAGHDAAQTPDFWQRYMSAAGKGATVYIIPTAADDPVKAGSDLAAAVKKAGGVPVVVPLAGRDLIKGGKNPFGADAQKMEDVAWVKSLIGGKAFLIADGNPDRLAKTLLSNETDDGPVLYAMHKAFEAGAAIGVIGDSVRVAGSGGFRKPRALSEMIRYSMQWELDFSFGLQLAPQKWFIDYGVGANGNLARLVLALANLSSSVGIGMDSRSIVVLDKEKIAFAGWAPSALVKLPEAAKAELSAVVPFTVSALNSGDTFTIANGDVTFDASRKPVPAPAKAPEPMLLPDATQPNAFLAQVQQIGLGKAGKTTVIAADWPSAGVKQAKAQVFTIEAGGASKAASDDKTTSVANLTGALIRDQFLAFPVYQATENN